MENYLKSVLGGIFSAAILPIVGALLIVLSPLCLIAGFLGLVDVNMDE